MLDAKQLKAVIHQRALSKTDQALLCLAVDAGTAKSPAEIRALAISAGVPAAKSWDVSAILGGSRGRAIRTPSGWELGATGKKRIEEILPSIASAKPHATVASSVRTAVAKLSNQDSKAFVEQSVQCFEAGFFRAAVVLSWVGAVALLYDHVVAKQLPAFNAEALRRDTKWRQANTADDLARMKEHDFLQVIEAISVIGKSVKTELEACLKLRNGCGHPNSLKIGENRVAAHLETLVLNVFSIYA